MVAAQKERVDALVDFHLDAQEDQQTLHQLLNELSAELRKEKVNSEERFRQLQWQRQQDINQHHELIEEFKRLLDESHAVSNDYKLALEAVSTFEFVADGSLTHHCILRLKRM